MPPHRVTEAGLIKMIKRMQPPLDPGWIGIGDDAALFTDAPRGWLVSQDMLVEDVHFRRDWATPEQIGRKACEVNLSDLAAMGGQPRAALTSLALPPGVSTVWVENLYRGLTDGFSVFGVPIIGGDTVASRSGIVLDVTVLGTPAAQPVRRHGARPGDILMVSGQLGASRGGLELLQRGTRQPALRDDEQALLAAHLAPVARVALGTLAASWVRAMTDVSDALASEVRILTETEGLGADIWLDRLPLGRSTRAVAHRLGASAESWALFGGEDYELLMAVPSEHLEHVVKAASQAGTSVQAVGEVTSSPGLRWWRDGQPVAVEGENTTFDHFSQHPDN